MRILFYDKYVIYCKMLKKVVKIFLINPYGFNKLNKVINKGGYVMGVIRIIGIPDLMLYNRGMFRYNKD